MGRVRFETKDGEVIEFDARGRSRTRTTRRGRQTLTSRIPLRQQIAETEAAKRAKLLARGARQWTETARAASMAIGRADKETHKLAEKAHLAAAAAYRNLGDAVEARDHQEQADYHAKRATE